MTVSKTMFRSDSDCWFTPPELYQWLDRSWHFDFDPCPAMRPAGFDGLTIPWGESNFVNPPYGREIGKWLDKGVAEMFEGHASVFLLPARADTRWWYRTVAQYAYRLIFLVGRIKFMGATSVAPFPSALAFFAKDWLNGESRVEYYLYRAILDGDAEL